MYRPLLAGLAVCLLPLTLHAADNLNRVALPTDVQPTRYDVSIVPDAQHMSFTGSVKIALDVKAATKVIEFNSADLALNKVALDGKAAARPVFDTTKQTATLN